MRQVRLQLTLFVLNAAIAGGTAHAQAPAPAPEWSVTDCETCHEEAKTPAFERSEHATLEQSCGKCHPDVAAHAKTRMAGGKDGPVPTLKGLKAQEINATCLDCHEKGSQANYSTSMHDRRNVACVDCHGIHSYKSDKAQLKTTTDTETCVTCHKSERAKMLRTSHHPVREGKLGCASCHNPHDGNRPKMIKAESVNELCYACHAEKRGPFMFEHAPVRDDCVNCHEPHGSNHKRLLTQKLPTLCWNCHFTGSGHFGSGDNLSTEEGARIAPPGAPTGYPTANARFIEKSCMNCHKNIHGSNSPSGAYFVR